MCIRICILLVLAGLAAACGKSAIDEAQQFVPNKAPVITEFSVELTLPSGVKQKVGYWDGAAHPAPANSLTIGQAPVTVRASDPEGREVRFVFTLQGAEGTVAVFSTADGLCTATVDLDMFTESTDVQLAVRVNDDRKGAAAQTINLGTGLTSPVVTADDVGAGFLRSAASKQVTITATSTGYYQLIQVPANADGSAPAAPAFDNLKPFYYYETIGGERTLTIAGPTCADAADVRLIGGEGRYYVYIIFRDPNLQAGSLAIPAGLDDTPPVLALGAGSDRVGSLEPITVSATDALSGVDGSSITVDKSRSSALPPTAGRTAAGAFADGLITITPSHYWVYGVAVWGNQRNLTVIAKDEAGNTAEQRLDIDIYPQRIYIRNDAAAADGTWKVGPADNPYPNDSVSLRDAFSQAQVYLAAGESCEIWLEANDATNPQYTFSGTTLPSFDGGGTKSLAIFGSCINTGGVWSRGAAVSTILRFDGAVSSDPVVGPPHGMIRVSNAYSFRAEMFTGAYTSSQAELRSFSFLNIVNSTADISRVNINGLISAGGSGAIGCAMYGANSVIRVDRSILTSDSSVAAKWPVQRAVVLDRDSATADLGLRITNSILLPQLNDNVMNQPNSHCIEMNVTGGIRQAIVAILNSTMIFTGTNCSSNEILRTLFVNSTVAAPLNVDFRNNIVTRANDSDSPFVSLKSMVSRSLIYCTVENNCFNGHLSGGSYVEIYTSGGDQKFAQIVNGIFETSDSVPLTLGIANADIAPVFIDAPGGNYALDQTSPFPVLAGGADLLADGITVDYNGKPRTAGDGWSMGAFEW